jgi:hypothetical protein
MNKQNHRQAAEGSDKAQGWTPAYSEVAAEIEHASSPQYNTQSTDARWAH